MCSHGHFFLFSYVELVPKDCPQLSVRRCLNTHHFGMYVIRKIILYRFKLRTTFVLVFNGNAEKYELGLRAPGKV
jgi:hypothetical protein